MYHLCCIIASPSYCFCFQHGLYPTVGLQTPGEVVEANFGQQPFVFDIQDYMQVGRRFFIRCKITPVGTYCRHDVLNKEL